MRFGKNIWYGEGPLEKAFESASKLGFDYIEFSLDYPWPEHLTEKEVSLLKNLKKDFGLEIAFHAPWAGIGLAHPQQEIFDASIKIFKKCLKFASKFDPLYFNFHQLTPFHGTFKLKSVRKEIFKKAFESASIITKIGNDFGFEVTIENNPDIYFGTPKQIAFMLKIKNLKLTFDVGHATVAKWEIGKRKEVFMKEEIELKEWFSRFKDKILTVHLCDVLIERDKAPLDHVAFGKGNLNIKEIIELIKKTGCENLLLEIFRTEKNAPLKEKELEESLEIAKRLI